MRRDDADDNEAFTRPKRSHDTDLAFATAHVDDTAPKRKLRISAAIAAARQLPTDAALRAVTIAPAQIFEIDDQYGSLETGTSVTFVLTTSDPLEVTMQIQSAFVDGRVIELLNPQTTLYEKPRERYEQVGIIKKDE